MGAFESVMARFASLADADLERRWTWRGHPSNVRYALVRCLEEEQEALARARAAWEPTEAERILSFARRAFGDLRGLLIAIPDHLLDTARDGEWTLRRVLTHVFEIERRYAAQTLYAGHRRDDEPLRLAEGDPRLPPKDGEELSGGVASLLGRIATARDTSDAMLAAIPDAALERPADWTGVRVDVRLRLHRFAAHLVEHTIQCEKALDASGLRCGEARRIVRRIWMLRGELEAVASDEVLRQLDEAHAGRGADIFAGVH